MAEGKSAHRCLTVEEKVDILDQIGKKSYKILSEEYRVKLKIMQMH